MIDVNVTLKVTKTSIRVLWLMLKKFYDEPHFVNWDLHVSLINIYILFIFSLK